MKKALRRTSWLSAIVASNWAWQYMEGQNWMVAFERSYFQVVAVVLIWLVEATREATL